MSKVGVILDEDMLVMLDDVCNLKGKLVDSLEAIKNLVSKNKPEKCPVCNSDSINGVEVMGTYEGPLFWECDECDCAILRFEEQETEDYLQLAKGLWTNPIDWGYVPRSEFN